MVEWRQQDPLDQTARSLLSGPRAMWRCLCRVRNLSAPTACAWPPSSSKAASWPHPCPQLNAQSHPSTSPCAAAAAPCSICLIVCRLGSQETEQPSSAAAQAPPTFAPCSDPHFSTSPVQKVAGLLRTTTLQRYEYSYGTTPRSSNPAYPNRT